MKMYLVLHILTCILTFADYTIFSVKYELYNQNTLFIIFHPMRQ